MKLRRETCNRIGRGGNKMPASRFCILLILLTVGQALGQRIPDLGSQAPGNLAYDSVKSVGFLKVSHTKAELFGVRGEVDLWYESDTLLRVDWSSSDSLQMTSADFNTVVDRFQSESGIQFRFDTIVYLEEPFLHLVAAARTDKMRTRITYSPFSLNYNSELRKGAFE